MILSAQSSLEVMPEEAGYRVDRTTLVPGRSELVFRRVPPLTLRAPGMRQLVGEEQVWISLDLLDEQPLLAFDSDSRSMARRMERSTSSHAVLQQDDQALLQPLRDGRYRVTARLGDKRRGGIVMQDVAARRAAVPVRK